MTRKSASRARQTFLAMCAAAVVAVVVVVVAQSLWPRPNTEFFFGTVIPVAIVFGGAVVVSGILLIQKRRQK